MRVEKRKLRVNESESDIVIPGRFRSYLKDLLEIELDNTQERFDDAEEADDEDELDQCIEEMDTLNSILELL